MPATLTANEKRRERFGAALAEAMRVREFTQATLGAALGGWGQNSISAWKTGAALPTDVETVFRLEKVLKLSPGHLSKHLGFLPINVNASPVSVPEAVMADDLLDAPSRRIMLTAYQELAAAKRRHPSAHKVKSVKAKKRVA